MAHLRFLLLAFFVLQDVTGQSQQCGTTKCLKDEAICVNSDEGICECKGFTLGDGSLSCHSDEEDECKIISDSLLISYGAADGYKMNTACRYLASYYETTNRQTPSIKCKVRVYAHGERNGGRFYPRGFDATFVVETGSNSEYAGYRAFGRYENDFRYTLQTRESSNRENWQSVAFIIEEDVRFVRDSHNNRVVLEVPQCGARVIYRAENPSLKSGLVINVDKDEVHVDWTKVENKGAICLAPWSATVSSLANAQGLSNAQYLLDLWGFTASKKTTHPTSPQDCDDVKRTLDRCDDVERRESAFHFCEFILSKEDYVSCMEISSNCESMLVTSLYDKCLEAFCKGKREKCERVKSESSQKGCLSKLGSRFMDFDCDNLPVNGYN